MWAQIVLSNLGNGAAGDGSSININLALHSAGLGVFDAFFTSFCMILVSEVGMLLLFADSSLRASLFLLLPSFLCASHA